MGTTILIADDNPRLRAMIRTISTQEPDLQVVGEAEDGAEAIRLAHLLQPDIVLMDLVMPRVNGLEALRLIKMERPETKVIIITMHSEDAYRRTAEANGTDAFLLKKTLMTALLPAIQSVRSSMSPPCMS
jgi:DNA-binding NarL/FixJ family response regulator